MLVDPKNEDGEPERIETKLVDEGEFDGWTLDGVYDVVMGASTLQDCALFL